AFHSAMDAVNTALSAQRLLQHEAWTPAPIKVRMGIHTGTAQLNDTSAHTVYTGYATLASTQRVMSAGHGGQILLSGATRELVRDTLPTDTELLDLGEKRLKDLLRPEHLYQLNIAGLQTDFPPLKTLDKFQTNLPAQLTSFIGREKEVEQIKKRLEKNRLVTLTGSGGVGKTRLSIQTASELLSEYPNGVWLIELAPVTDPGLVTQTICTTLDVTPQGTSPALNVLIDYLKLKKTLLVVDNCEHLIDACAQLCEALLHTCPDLRIITSSREALGIEGENAYRVPSLAVPNSHDTLRTIQNSEAVKLFVDRANASLPEFEITGANAPTIAQICQRLDGIALAIELAASRVKMLKVEQIATRLDDAFRLLTGGSRTALPRQQTLRALIDWSYNLLNKEERTVLRSLSVFVGGWTLEAAEAVCDNSNMLDLLTHLVDKSLVAVDLEHGDEPRYYLLETIRQYAREKSAELNASEPIRDRHLSYFLALAERAEPEVQGAEQRIWFDRLELELDNFRAALEWSLAKGEQGTDVGLQLASSLWWFSFQRNHQDQGRLLKKALKASTTSTDPTKRAKALVRLAWVDFYDEAVAEEGLALTRTLGTAGTDSVALALLGKAAWSIYQADYAGGKLLAEESLKIYRELGDRWGICEALTWLGLSLIDMGDHQQSIPPLEGSLTLARQAHDGNEIAFALWQLGRAAMLRNDYIAASDLMTESLAIFKELKLLGGVAFLLIDLGKAVVKQGDYERAVSHYKEVLTIYWNWGIDRNIADGLEQLASAVMHLQPEHAAQLLGSAEALRQSSNSELFPYQKADYEHNLNFLRSHLDGGALTTCWAEGRAMNVKQAVENALGKDL
ncbi:MAG TPA: tetratricopeptide repeat protein, partial [Anaerolineales bacterium]|nr:tetratricopeptide repeat protein [Anaerolineales bacterium]